MATADDLHKLSHAERQIIAKKKVKTYHTITDFKLSAVVGANGYLGEYSRLEMTIKETTGESKKHQFFMKTIPVDGWQNQLLSNEGAFQKEVNFYNSLRPLLSTDVCPECFLAVPGKIVLADAASQGYHPLTNLVEPLDYEHIKLGLEALARMHVGSIIYEEKTGKKVGSEFPDLAREAGFCHGGSGLDFLRCGGEAIAALAPHLDTNLGRDPESVSLLQEHVVPWMNKLEHYLNDTFPHRPVICHGDSWPANFLYRYNDNGKPTNTMLIDFQLTRLRSPAVDVNTFLYLSVPMDDLKQWRDSLLDAYYHVIAEEMRKSGLDSNAIYPKEEFLRACIFYQIVGVIFGLLFFPFSRVPHDKMAEATSTKEKAFEFFYKDRRKHLIECYKEGPLLRRFVNGVTDELYQYFIKTQRGLTEFTP